MIVKVLGKGCKNCQKLGEIVAVAAKELNVNVTIEKVTDINEIADYGVLRTPALVINETVVLQGKLPTVENMKKLLTQ